MTLTGAYTLRLPAVMQSQIDAIDAIAPLSAPHAVLSVSDDDLILSDKAEAALRGIGTPIRASVMQYTAADGQNYDLLALPQTHLSDAVTLTEGRMPQNETECIVVPLTGCGTVCKIGAAVLLPTDGACSLYTVVGIGTDRHAELKHLSGTDRHARILTTDTAAWCDAADAADVVLLSTDNAAYTKDAQALHYAVSAVEKDCYAEQLSVLTDALQTAYDTAEQAVWEADEAVHRCEISILDAENKYNTAALRASEAENELLAASNALETERQQFYSDMETYEYYSSGQLALINRRDLAEESFAEQKAALVQLEAALAQAYAARDAANAYLLEMQAPLAALLAKQAAAHAALDRCGIHLQSDMTVPSWSISLRTEEPDYIAAVQRTEAAQQAALPYLIVSAVLVAVLSCTLIRLGSHRKQYLAVTVCAVLASGILGAVLGVTVMPTWFVI